MLLPELGFVDCAHKRLLSLKLKSKAVVERLLDGVY
jgi:hypothetical protein